MRNCKRCAGSGACNSSSTVAPNNQPIITQDLFAFLPEIINSKTAAIALSVPERTIRELARNGELRGFKIGSNWRFTRQSIVNYVKQQEASLLGGEL